MWTPDGYRAVETLLPGEVLYSRDQYDPSGEIVVRVIEEVFVRTGRILHLHMQGGMVIRTTPEHPFFVSGGGWLPAAYLKGGEWLLSATGEWLRCEEALDTGEYERVYNCRVAEHHTYFVGQEGWGHDLWAHNTYTRFSSYDVADTLTGASVTSTVVDSVVAEIQSYGSFGDVSVLQKDLLAKITTLGATATNLTVELNKIVDTDLGKKAVESALVAFRKKLDGKDWTDHLNKIANGDVLDQTYPGKKMTINGKMAEHDTHAHHIVYKKGLGATQKAYAIIAQDVMLYNKYAIDPYYAKEALVWAPNHGHPQSYVNDAQTELLKIYKAGGSRDDVVKEMKRLAQQYIDDSRTI